MGGGGPTRLIELLLNLPAIWLILWVGLAALSIALLVLMRTGWGQSRPLRKCAALSLLAHVLLACFATTVKIVSDTAGAPSAPTVWVTLADAPDTTDGQQTATRTKLEQMWDAPSEPGETPTTAPERADTATTVLPDRTEPEDMEKIPSDLSSDKPLAAPVPVPDGSALAVKKTTRQTTKSAAEKIEAPRAERRVPEETQPLVSTPERAEISGSGSISNRHDASENAALEHFEVFKPTPRMVEVRQTDRSESAVPSFEDLLTRATSPLPASAPSEIEGQSQADRATNPSASTSTSATNNVVNPIRQEGPPGAVVDGDSGSNRVSLEAVTEADRRKHEVPGLYRGRIAEERARLAQRAGGGPETEAAVEAALRWLAANQSTDGRWDADHYGAGRERQILGHNRQGAGVRADTATTALALLAFLGAGHTHENGTYRQNVQHGLEFLIGQQAANGDLAGQASLFARMYSHSMATFALSEAYAITGDDRLQPAVLQAVRYSVGSQDPVSGGWRYQPRDPGDTSQLGWQIMALRSAEMAGIQIPGETRMRMVRFLNSVTSGRHGGLASYRPHQPPSRTMTAEALLCRQLLQGARSPQAAAEASAYLAGELPGEGRANLYYWYYGTLSMHQLQGHLWRRWNEALKTTLIQSQVGRGDLAGSWEPDTVWGGYGGRVYSTAMAAMCLEVYYRYLPVYVEAVGPRNLLK